MFDRTLTVPIQVDADRIKAEYRDGLLALFIPRVESASRAPSASIDAIAESNGGEHDGTRAPSSREA